jgi:glutamyl-tRNA synthetase
VRDYDTRMTVKVRFAPSPTGFLHIGGVRTALFNWLFARHLGGEFHLRIENTDTGREVAEATEQIKESLSWLGLDWDGPVTFQLDRSERCRVEVRRLLEEGKAYEDEGAIRIRMPDEGVTGWDDAVRGRVEVPSEELEDLIILRSDGRPTYNFASPLEDWLDGITHVIRGDDHVSNTPKQIRVLEALGAEVPVYAHVGNVLGTDGKKLSKRHGAVGVDEFRREGYLPEALVNYLALLGWSYDDHTTIMSREELVERFTIERVIARPATFDYEKLEWMNGVYLRELDEAAYAAALTTFLGEQGLDWDSELVRRTVPIVHEKLVRLDRYPEYAGFFFRDVTPDAKLLDRKVLAAAEGALAELEPFDTATIEQAMRSLAESLELKPGKAFQPVRAAITGTNVSPSLFESIELLGREKTLERLRSAAALVGD